MSNPTTTTALRRKIERLEAQLESIKEFLHQDRESEFTAIRRNADMAVRINQAIKILEGKDE